MLRKFILGIFSIVLIGSAGFTAHAEDPPKEEDAWYKQIEVSGFVDGYYVYNFNRPESRINQLRAFDATHNQFQLALAELVFQKAPSPVGFRLDLNFGQTTDLVHGCGSPTGNAPFTDCDTFKNVQQMYASWTAPVGRGLTIDFGKFVTHMGLEVIESKDNWNYSRSLLFTWAIPFYHTGLRANLPVTDMVTVNGYVLNGWDNVADGNNAKTFGAQVLLNPMPGLTVIGNWIGGAEGTNGTHWRNVFDAIVTYSPMDKLAFALNYDYGFERSNTGGTDPHWSGVAGYARFAPNDWYAFAPRLEWFRDSGGLRTGATQTLYEMTLTNEFKLHKNLITRLEYRRDWSTGNNAFEAHDGTFSKGHQDTAIVGVVYSF